MMETMLWSVDFSHDKMKPPLGIVNSTAHSVQLPLQHVIMPMKRLAGHTLRIFASLDGFTRIQTSEFFFLESM
jgi:hypothetical protein